VAAADNELLANMADIQLRCWYTTYSSCGLYWKLLQIS